MKKSTIQAIFGLVLIGIISLLQARGLGRELSSRSPEKNISLKIQKLTIEDIRNNYKEEGRTVTQAFSYESYLLVESKLIGIAAASRFELFNLETGTRTILPTSMFNVRLREIVNENDFVFLADGTNAEFPQVLFPFILECQRNDARETFYATRKPAYLPIVQECCIGNKKDVVILSIKVALEGVEILFGPMKGKEGKFWAGYYSPPEAHMKYVAEKSQFLITFINAKPDESLSKDALKAEFDNAYISSLDIDEIGGNCRVTLNLTGEAKYYTGELRSLRSSSRLPYVVISFAKEIEVVD